MRFDSNRAWREASASVSGNRDVLVALAGVFLLLPSLAFSLFVPQPTPAPGMSEEQMLALMSAYYTSALPLLIPMALVQAGGTLSILTLFTDRNRPTVGQAIRRGFVGVLPYIVAQILFGMALGLAAGLLLMVGSLTGVAAIAAVSVVLALALAIWAAIRISLVAPIVVVEGQRNPIAALLRSWSLTRGNVARLGVFYALVIVAFLVIMILVMAVVGVVLALIAGGEVTRVVAAVFSSALGAALTVYLVAILAAAHRQLAGSPVDGIAATFD